MILKTKIQGFSIIEILIGMFIFSLGIISVYAVITSSVRVNEYNKNYIIASNLAREQLELVRNNRDYNYKHLQKFDQINPANTDYSNVFQEGFYGISNNTQLTANFPIKIESITDINNEDLYQLCLDSNNMYVYCENDTTLKKTQFYKYIHVEKLDQMTLRVTSKVIWKIKGIHEFEVKTIFTDWKQL